MKFKTEVALLVAAILLFVTGALFYSYQIVGSAGFSQSLSSYPYQSYGLAFAGFGSLLMVTASLSYSKRSKTAI